MVTMTILMIMIKNSEMDVVGVVDYSARRTQGHLSHDDNRTGASQEGARVREFSGRQSEQC